MCAALRRWSELLLGALLRIPDLLGFRAARAATLDRLPVLASQEERLAEAVATNDGSVSALVAALKARQQERQDLESRLAELETWERDAQADRDRVEQLRARWGSWQGALDEDPVLARQVLKKVLATPVYVRPTGRREWTYVGIGRYDGILNGGVAPGEVVAAHKQQQDPSRRPGCVPAGPRSEHGGPYRRPQRRVPDGVQDPECQLGAPHVQTGREPTMSAYSPICA